MFLGFPLAKAIKYAELRKPFTINDLYFQYDIQDRRRVYKILEDARIELPRYAVLNREFQGRPLSIYEVNDPSLDWRLHRPHIITHLSNYNCGYFNLFRG